MNLTITNSLETKRFMLRPGHSSLQGRFSLPSSINNKQLKSNSSVFANTVELALKNRTPTFKLSKCPHVITWSATQFDDVKGVFGFSPGCEFRLF